MKNSSKNIPIIISIILSIAVIALGVLFFLQHKDLQEKTQELSSVTAEMEFEKQQSVEEFEQIAHEYENFYINTSNDSLLKLIDNEKQKVQQLLQELKTVKATNTRRIGELKKELSTVRGVLKSYVEKVDSLNALNQNLQKENYQVRQQYEQTAKELEQKAAEAAELDKKVSMAAILEASNINISLLNEKGQPTKSLRKTASFEICFDILRNITAERGKKMVYMRITDYKEELMTLPGQNTFNFEGNQIEFSGKKEIEYGGEAVLVCIYYPIQEKLTTGTYSIAIFMEGNLIGSKSFAIK